MSAPSMRRSDSFAYRAARADGSIERGILETVDRLEAVDVLRRRGLLPIELTKASAALIPRSKVGAADLAIGFRTLATLLSSGMSVSRALAAFEDVAPNGWTQGITDIRERVSEGQSLGAAMEHSALAIPRLLTGIVRAGEGGSGLAASARRAADLAESSARLRDSIRSALAYPILLAVVGAASMAIIVMIVLPRFAAIIADVGGDIPPLARTIMTAGMLARELAIPGLITAIGVVTLWRTWASHSPVRLRIHAALLASPVLGPMRLSAASSRACSALSALLDAGVPVAAALSHAARATGDDELARRLLAARDRIVAGARLSASLLELEAITPTAGKLLRAGEESGQLPQMLERAAEIDTDRVTERLRALVRLLEPALIIGFAAMIAIVSGALLQTVYAVKP